MDSFELVSSLQALPEMEPVEVDGIQFGPTCVVQQACINLSLQVSVIQTVQAGVGVGNVLGALGLGRGSARC